MLIAEGCVIAEGAQVKGPTMLNPQCEIGKNANVEKSVLWSGSRVEEEAVLRSCITASHVCVQKGSYPLENCVLGDNVTEEPGYKLPEGTRVEPNTCLSTDRK